MGRRRPATHHTFVQNKRIRVVLLDGTIVRGRFVRSLRDAIIVLRDDAGVIHRLPHLVVRVAQYERPGMPRAS
jgi:hypothetical protein